jgi:hypothetical protein
MFFMLVMYLFGYSREFTHRVKSVSMSKFTSQEVENLENGGNEVCTDVLPLVYVYCTFSLKGYHGLC